MIVSPLLHHTLALIVFYLLWFYIVYVIYLYNELHVSLILETDSFSFCFFLPSFWIIFMNCLEYHLFLRPKWIIIRISQATSLPNDQSTNLFEFIKSFKVSKYGDVSLHISTISSTVCIVEQKLSATSLYSPWVESIQHNILSSKKLLLIHNSLFVQFFKYYVQNVRFPARSVKDYFNFHCSSPCIAIHTSTHLVSMKKTSTSKVAIFTYPFLT